MTVPARALRAGDGHRAGADRGPPGRRDRQQHRCTWPARSPATAPTRRRASCSSATPSACRSSRSSTRPGMMVGPEAEATGLVRHCSRLLVAGRGAARAARRGGPAPRLRPRRPGDGRRQPARAAAHRRLADGRTSARWASRARCGSACARSSRRSPTRPSASSASRELTAAAAGERQGAQRRHAVRARRRDRPGRDPRADRRDARRGRPRTPRRRRGAPLRRHLVSRL